MILLTHPDLPDNPSTEKAGVFLRLWNGSSRRMAPIFKFDRLAGYIPNTVEEVIIPISKPDYGGYVYKVPLSVTVTTVKSLTINSVSIPVVKDPIDCFPGSCWHDASRLVVIAAPGTPVGTGNSAVMVCEVQKPVIVDGSIGSITVDTGLSVSKVVVSGLTFTAAVSTPQPGEFTQNDTTITLTLGTGFNIPNAALATLTGSFTETLPVSQLSALFFDLSAYDSIVITGIDYLGIAFADSADRYKPVHGELFWNSKVLSLFVSNNSGSGLVMPHARMSGSSFAGTTSYETFGG